MTVVRRNPGGQRITRTRRRGRPSVSGTATTPSRTPRHDEGPLSGAVFFNHATERCGVYQMGARIGRALEAHGVAWYCEATTMQGAASYIRNHRPRVAIYNWHPATIPWAHGLMRQFPSIKHVGLIHEISPENVMAGSEIFALRIVSDPSFPNAPGVFSTIRHIPRADPPPGPNARFTVGSFGFAVGGKMFGEIASAVGREFPGALLRLRVPSAHYGDDAGALAQATAEGVRGTGADVELQIEHDFLSEAELITWLQGNDLNVFFYDYNPGRGISSVIDYAIAARRPIAINGSQMFRHVSDALGTYPDRSLVDSLDSDNNVVQGLYDEWNVERMVDEYRRILDCVTA